MKTFKKILSILLATTVFAGHLNGMYQKEPPLALQVDPKEFDWKEPKHVQELKNSYNNNLRMIIIIACSIRGQMLIEKRENIKSTIKKGERILYLPVKDRFGKKINAAYFVESIDSLLQNFIDKLMLLIEQMPELFEPHNDLLPHQKRMGLIKRIKSYLDQDPIQIRANNNLTTKESRTVTGQGQITRDITNVNAKFKQCLANLEIILQLLDNLVSSQKKTQKIIAIPQEKQTALRGLRRNSTGTMPTTHFVHHQIIINPNKEQKNIIDNLSNQIANFYKIYATPPGTPR